MSAWCHYLIKVSLGLYRDRISTYRDKVWTCRDRLWIFRALEYNYNERRFAYFEKFSLLLKLVIAVAGVLLFLSLFLNIGYIEIMSVTQDMLVTDHRLERVNKVVQTLLQSNPALQDRRTNWIVNVLNDSRANAFANTSFGIIVVLGGMLELVPSDDELSFVLGHEMAHLALKHGPYVFWQSRIWIWVNVTGLLFIWLTFRSFFLAIMTVLIMSGLVLMLTILQDSRHSELDADYLGFVIVANAGYDTRQAGNVMRKFAELSRDSWIDRFPTWLFSHPDALERAAYLDYFDQDIENRRHLALNRSCQ